MKELFLFVIDYLQETGSHIFLKHWSKERKRSLDLVISREEWDFFCGSHFLKCHKTFLSLTVKQENHNLPPLFICEYCSHCRWYRLSYGTYACAFLQGEYFMSCMVTQELTMMDEWWLYLYMLKKISKENMFETHGLYLFLYFSIRETVQKTIYYYTHSLTN